MKNNAEKNITKPKTKTKKKKKQNKTKQKKPSFVHNVKKKYKIKPNF